MFEAKTNHEIERLIDDAKKELKLREEGEKKPVYIFSGLGTNQCFKNKDTAISEMSSEVFEHGDTEKDYSQNINSWVRWVPIAEYEQLPDEWIEV